MNTSETKIFSGDTKVPEMELMVHNSWITNQFLDSTNQKIVKLSFFTHCFFQNMITLMISVCLSVYSIQGVKLNDERIKFCELCGYTFKIRLSNLLHEAIFFIQSMSFFFLPFFHANAICIHSFYPPSF